MKPEQAVSIWVSGDILHVELPNLHGKQSHFLKLPLNVWGMTQLVEIIKVRKETSRIGESGDPTQAQIEAEMKKLSRNPIAISKTKTPPVSTEVRLSVINLVRKYIR